VVHELDGRQKKLLLRFSTETARLPVREIPGQVAVLEGDGETDVAACDSRVYRFPLWLNSILEIFEH
jgi:hypothetical protein